MHLSAMHHKIYIFSVPVQALSMSSVTEFGNLRAAAHLSPL